MKKTIRILIPIILAITIVLCTAWYLFVYDRAFTRDMLLSFARYSESHGKHSSATWFYNLAYSQAGDNDAVAIELAEQYKSTGNYTKAEFTLSNAIADGGGIDLYIALCKTYVEQDKLLDAVTMLDNITNEHIKKQLDEMRPAAPTASPEPGFYNQYISATVHAQGGTTYVSTDGQYPSTGDTPYSESLQLKDGENTIHALTVAENGLVSPLSIFGYTIGGVIEVMDFADPAVEAEVRKLLNVSADAVLYNNDLWTIKEFTMPAEAKNYADIKHMTFLESLVIEKGTSGQISNFSALANLTSLKITGVSVSQVELNVIASLPLLKNLTLQNCSITGITPLKNITGLEILDLSNNTIRDLSAISGMQNLKELNLQHNAVTDLSALASVPTLTKLDVSYNALTSLAPICSLTGLTWLDAGTNSITELGDISKLTALTYLSVKSNKLTNVSAIAGCTALTDLNISSNQLTDIAKLSALTKMLYFDFSYNQVTKLPAFPKDCELVNINGSNNKLTSLDNLGGLENLNNVNMDYNKDISSVKALAKCPVLIEVNVYATKVKDVTPLTNQNIIVNWNPVK
jgi:Leucine-rich repeat (LRR) protein